MTTSYTLTRAAQRARRPGQPGGRRCPPAVRTTTPPRCGWTGPAAGSTAAAPRVTVAPTQPSEYARCSAAATVGRPGDAQHRHRHRGRGQPGQQRPPASSYSAPNAVRISHHGPSRPAATTRRFPPRDQRRGCEQRTQPPGPVVDEVRRSGCPASRSGAPAVVPGSASPPGSPPAGRPEFTGRGLLSSTGKPITRIALAPAAAIEVRRPAGTSGSRGARPRGRRRGRGTRSAAPARTAHRRRSPTGTRPGPSPR